MYKLSYKKCVCFIFLVMVAFLSCSGFRIDKLAMTDISSKRNPYTSSTTLNIHSDFLNRLQINRHQRKPRDTEITETPREKYLTRKYSQRSHRIRHSRKSKQRAQASHFEPNPTSRIDAIIIPKIEFDPFRTSTRSTSERFAQIPASDELPPKPTTAIVARSQRSPNKNRKKPQRNKQLPCQEQDLARKAFLANTVVLARAESMSSNRIRNYSVSFKIVEKFKSPHHTVDDNLRLTFLNDSKHMNCESELHGGTYGVIKAVIQQSKEYYLFLNSHGIHNYSVLGMPVLKRKRKYHATDKIIRTVTNKNFEPRLKVPVLNATTTNLEAKSKLKLFCKVRGYPIPIISWRKDNTDLHSNNHTRITYSNKGEELSDRRKSTLVIKSTQEKDTGRYYCIATGVRGQPMAAHKDIQIYNRQACPEEFRQTYCLNNGTCEFYPFLREMSCICADGFQGKQCENKITRPVNMASRYHECKSYPTEFC